MCFNVRVGYQTFKQTVFHVSLSVHAKKKKKKKKSSQSDMFSKTRQNTPFILRLSIKSINGITLAMYSYLPTVGKNNNVECQIDEMRKVRLTKLIVMINF